MPENRDQEKNKERWLILQAKLVEKRIKNAFQLLRRNGIEPILIKGWAAARFYPKSYLRIFADIDLCVEPRVFEKTRSLLETEEGKTLNVDLHKGLRHLDKVQWENLFENTQIVMLEDTAVRILRPEDHLRVVCVHWLNDGGANKERLLDIFYAVQNRPKDFSWDRCLGVVSETRREWIIKTIGLVKKYCDLDTSDLPFAEDAEEIPSWIIRTLEREWSNGVRLKPLNTVMKSKSEFWQQIKKRIPPNAIQSTIEMEGKFDRKHRIFYQIGSMSMRIKPSFIRFYRVFWKKNERDD